jgi:predicted nucleic acid-binding Zn ribbon protein
MNHNVPDVASDSTLLSSPCPPCLYGVKKSMRMPKGPETIGNILAELAARRGFARVQSCEALEAAWRQAAGPLAAQYTRVGSIRRGTLEVTVANSTLVQELAYQKQEILSALRQLLPDEKIKDLRLRAGSMK